MLRQAYAFVNLLLGKGCDVTAIKPPPATEFTRGDSMQLGEHFPQYLRATVTAHIGSLQMDRRNALRLRYRLMQAGAAWKSTRDLDIPTFSFPSAVAKKMLVRHHHMAFYIA